MGIGINTGPVAAGPMLYSDSIVNLVLGDTVNTAARIESLTKFFSVDILISESTEERARGLFNILPMPPKEIRGKQGKCKTFWVTPIATSNTK
jgi:adenylate cyclase